ncbi:hypothetical protein [Streptomyces mirabilis]|uniref:hypothetical protein n=1 Tax=Streptomyces mirabilis TaxID=68239 RepID=UPI0036D89688
MAGPGRLPRTTARRIIQGTALPIKPQQFIAFLYTCYVFDDLALEAWLAAADRAYSRPDSGSSARHLETWIDAHIPQPQQAFPVLLDSLRGLDGIAG